MTLTMTIPDDVSLELGGRFENIGRAALEALAADSYAGELLSLEQVRRMLDLSTRWEAQEVLEQHGVWPGTTVEDVQSDLLALEQFHKSA